MEQKQLLAEKIGLSHVAIIMDGNGRWASARGLARNAGHREGARALERVLRTFSSLGVRCLTLYAFSTENWRRPEDEVGALMKLFKSYLEEAISDFKDDDIVVRFIGDKSGFSPELQALMDENEECSRERDGMVLNIAMNYGSRDEIVRAVKRIASDVKDGKISESEIFWEIKCQTAIQKRMATREMKNFEIFCFIRI